MQINFFVLKCTYIYVLGMSNFFAKNLLLTFQSREMKNIFEQICQYLAQNQSHKIFDILHKKLSISIEIIWRMFYILGSKW